MCRHLPHPLQCLLHQHPLCISFFTPALSLPSLCITPTPDNPCPPLAVDASCPSPPFPLSISILLSWASANLEQGLHLSKVTHTFLFQAPMTVTNMYIMLSDSVRHASSLLLFIWKLFNVSGLCVMETYSGSFLYHDSHFAGVGILRHMNIKHILHLNSRNLAKALIQSDLQKESSMGGCQFLAVVNFTLSWQL